jgi:hypothetical protein
MGVEVSPNLNSPRERAAKTPPSTTRIDGGICRLGPRPGPNVTFIVFLKSRENAFSCSFQTEDGFGVARSLSVLGRRFTAQLFGVMEIFGI